FQVVLAGFFPPPSGGESIHVRALSLRLRELGVLKQIVNLRREAPQSPHYITRTGPLQLLSALMHLLSKQTLLHLHAHGHSWKSWAIIICVAVALRIRRRPGVFTLHSGMAPSFLGGINAVGRWAVRWALAAFPQILCVNEEIRRALARLGVPIHRL